MPSSVGHALAGFAMSRLFGGRFRDHCADALVATSPDLDILAAVLRKRSINYARRRSHSAGAAFGVGIVTGGASWLIGGRFAPRMLRSTAAYGSHLLLDYFGKEAENGIPLLWPASNRLFAADRHIFGTIYSAGGNFFGGLITPHNLRRIVKEIAVVMPAVVAADLLGRALRSLGR